MEKFDGKLTSEELTRLQEALFTEKQIREIEKFVYEHRESLNGFFDLVGDDLVPTKQFLFNMKRIGYLLDTDPDKVLSKFGIKIKGMTTARLVKLLAENFMTSKVVMEDRNELKAFAKKKNELENDGIIGVNPVVSPDEYEKDLGVKLPKGPVIFAPNHHFKDDALATVIAADKPITFMFGSIPLYFNTTDGILTYLIGAILINRKNANSRNATLPKANRAIDLGANLFWAPEGVHNKTANLLMLEPWSGIYRAANEKGIPVVPIIHYIFDPTQKILPHELNPIHTVVDDPIDLTKFTEKQGLTYLRDVISSWYYLMMEKYGTMSKEDMILAYEERAKNYGITPEELTKMPLSAHEIGELYNMDLRTTVNGYDKSIEANADCRPRSIVRPEDIYSNVSPETQDLLFMSDFARERKKEDYQRRF